MLSSCLRAAKVSSKVPFCDYDEETNSYVSLSRTAERNRHFATDRGIRTGYFTVTEQGKRHGCL